MKHTRYFNNLFTKALKTKRTFSEYLAAAFENSKFIPT